MAPVLGALFAILIGILALRPYFIYQRQSYENIKAANTASQFRQLINAASLYVQDNCLPTANNNEVPESCANMSVTQLLPQLQSAGYLPQGIAATNPYGQGWYITVWQAANGTVQALLYSADGQQIPEKLAPEIAAETGQEGGFVPYPNQYGNAVAANTAEGAYGHWNTPFPSGITPVQGHLAALLDVGQNGIDDDQDSDYLYRRQVPGDTKHQLNTMQTDLNMGGNNIVNAEMVQTITPNQQSYASMQSADTQSSLIMNGSTAVTLDMTGGQSAALNLTGGASGASLNMASSGISALNLTGTNGATLTVGSQGATTGLVISSTPQQAGANCSKLGTIAPNQDGSGMPVVCTDISQSQNAGVLSLSAGADGTTMLSLTPASQQNSQPSQATWQVWGEQNFTSLKSIYLQPASLNGSTPTPGQGIYVNDTGRSLFVSSNCPINQGTSGEGGASTGFLGFGDETGTSLNFYINSNVSALANNYTATAWTLSGVSLTGGEVGSPSSSVIIPPGYAFAYSLYINKASGSMCQFTIAY